MAALRQHCSWTASQTHASLVPFALEEAQEVADVVAQMDPDPTDQQVDALVSELGDLLFQVVFHAALLERLPGQRRRDLGDVMRTLRNKLTRRSPHVFAADGSVAPKAMSPEQIARQWDAIKAQEPSSGQRPNLKAPAGKSSGDSTTLGEGESTSGPLS